MYIVELNKLMVGLEERKIPYSFRIMEKLDGYQVCGQNWDAICNKMSIGSSQGLLEVYGSGLVTEPGEVVGYLTAEMILSALDKNETFSAGYWDE